MTSALDHKRGLILFGIITLGALGYSGHSFLRQADLEAAAALERGNVSKALAGQRNAAERLHTTALLLGDANARNMEARAHIGAMEARLQEAEERARALAGRAQESSARSRELTDLRTVTRELRDELEHALDAEGRLRAEIELARAERDALAHRLELQEAGAMIVNNAEVDALMGRRRKLTVKARRTREVHMAFDLPVAMAGGVNYRIFAPDGTECPGVEPVVAHTSIPANATASAGLSGMPSATERVDLRFKTGDRLRPGSYRIEVRSGKDELQTIRLNLR